MEHNITIKGEEELFDPDDYEEIYRINGNNKTYVGRSKILGKRGSRGGARRFVEHIGSAKKGSMANCSRLLTEAIMILGENAFDVQHIEIIHTSIAAQREIYWINQLGTQSPYGYNLTGGRDDRYELHSETKALMSKSHRSYGRDGVKNFTASVHRINAPQCVGYRGYYEGIPRGFFGTQFSLEEKKAMAIRYHLFGEYEFEQRLPRARSNLDADNNVLPTGVKYNPKKVSKPYRAYHPQRQAELKSPYFETIKDAKEYADLLQSFPPGEEPHEFRSVKRDLSDVKDPYLLYVKPRTHSKGTTSVYSGTLIGYEVVIPASATQCGEAKSKAKLNTEFSIEQNLADALYFRQAHMKPELIPVEPDWVADLPAARAGPDMSFISTKSSEDGPYGYEISIPNKYSLNNQKFYQACVRKSLSQEENLLSALEFRNLNVRPGVIEDIPAGKIHSMYLEEKHHFMSSIKSGGSKSLKKGTVVGWSVDIPAGKSNDGERHRDNFKNKTLQSSLDAARECRAKHCKTGCFKND